MSKMVNPIIFDLKYTPFVLPKNSTAEEQSVHQAERAFYNMTGETNVFKYITTEGKRSGKFTALEYLQKSTGVFNDKGMIGKVELEEMKSRLKENKGHIFHGFISLCEEDSPKIDSPEKCIELVKHSFGIFLKEGGFNVKNIDLMCALHLDKPHHLHIHFVFWEKVPKIYDKNGNLKYRFKGKVCKKAIDNMYVRIAEFLSDEKCGVYERRTAALKELREAVSIRNINTGSDKILKEIVLLAKDLPKSGRLSYGSCDMDPFKGRVDKIVKMLIGNNGKARRAEVKFYTELERKKKRIAELCRQPQVYGNSIDGKPNRNYRYGIEENNITVIKDIKEDYKRRQGNLVLSLAKFMKPEIYERKKGRKYKSNDNTLKRSLSMSSKKTSCLFKKFILSFGSNSELLERDFNNRLQQIEEEFKREKEKQNKKEEEQKT